MKASDLLAILEHNDPGVLARVRDIRNKLKALESYDKCASCSARVTYEYRRAAGKLGDEILVERSTCQACYAKGPVRAHIIH